MIQASSSSYQEGSNCFDPGKSMFNLVSHLAVSKSDYVSY